MLDPISLDILAREHLNDLHREAANDYLADQATAHQAPRRWPTLRISLRLSRPALPWLAPQRRNVAL